MNHILALNYIKQHSVKSILNLGTIQLKSQTIPKHCTNTLHIKDQSFDFIYGDEYGMSKVFHSPCRMISELMRIPTKGGWIETMSPLAVGLYNIPPKIQDFEDFYIVWTDVHTNTLCFMPYYRKMCTPRFDREDWFRLVSMYPIYMNNFFVWTHPMEINYRLHLYDSIEEYEYLLFRGIRSSAEHTRFLIEKYLE